MMRKFCGCHQFMSLRGQEQIWTTLMLRRVIWHLFFEIWAKVKNILKLSHLYTVSLSYQLEKKNHKWIWTSSTSFCVLALAGLAWSPL
jgi:hypothetical protein